MLYFSKFFRECMPPFRGAKVGGGGWGVATPTEFSVGKLVTYVLLCTGYF